MPATTPFRQRLPEIRHTAAIACGAPLKQIIGRTGYRSPGAFTAAFRRVFGVTPGQWRPDTLSPPDA
jgi:AraC-like DNA-binding protein